MKKIILCLLTVLLSAGIVNAQSINFDGVKKIFGAKKAPVETPVSADSDDTMTKSQQSVLFYSENNINAAFEVLLSIKEGARTPQDWLLLGNILQDQGKVSDAVFMYKRAILVNPKYYRAYYNLGNIYLEEERPYLAIENYKLAVKYNPEFAYGYYNLGCAYLKSGNIKKAKVVFLRAVEIKNTEPDFHYNLAYTYKKLNKPKQAQEYLNNYNKLMLDRQ